MLTVFTCNDMEASWIAQICADGEYEMAEWERQEDAVEDSTVNL